MRSSLALFRSRWYVLGLVDRDGVVGPPRRRALAGADLAGAVGDRRRPGAADRHRRPAVRPAGDAPRVDRRRARGARASRSWRRRSAAPAKRPLRLRRGPAVPMGRRRSRPSRRGRGEADACTRRRRFSAISAGLFWAASDTSIKALSGQLGDGAARSCSARWPLVIALASFAGLVVSARSLQIGRAVPVIAVTSVAANVFTIAAGPDRLRGAAARHLARRGRSACSPSGWSSRAAALTPAPTRAADLEAG